MGGLSPSTLGKALGLAVPERESTDSPLEVARAKLALAQKGWDAYVCKTDGPVLKRRKFWLTTLARFYMEAAQTVVARAREARPMERSGLQPFGAVGSYRPMQGFSKMNPVPEEPGLDSLGVQAVGLVR